LDQGSILSQEVAVRAAAILLCSLVPLAAPAQDVRVGTAIGPVNVQPGQVLATGDHVVTGAAARIDLYIDPSVHLRLYPNAEVQIVAGAGGEPRIDLAHGEILSGVVDLAPVRFEIGTPQVAVRPDMPGSIRVVVDPSMQSEIDALTSDVEVVALTGSRWLRMGQKMYVRGTAANPEFKIVDAITLVNPPPVVAIDLVRIVTARRSRPADDRGPLLPVLRPQPSSSAPASANVPHTSANSARPGRAK
jgi:hypothetical protein